MFIEAEEWGLYSVCRWQHENTQSLFTSSPWPLIRKIIIWIWQAGEKRRERGCERAPVIAHFGNWWWFLIFAERRRDNEIDWHWIWSRETKRERVGRLTMQYKRFWMNTNYSMAMIELMGMLWWWWYKRDQSRGLQFNLTISVSVKLIWSTKTVIYWTKCSGYNRHTESGNKMKWITARGWRKEEKIKGWMNEL